MRVGGCRILVEIAILIFYFQSVSSLHVPCKTCNNFVDFATVSYNLKRSSVRASVSFYVSNFIRRVGSTKLAAGAITIAVLSCGSPSYAIDVGGLTHSHNHLQKSSLMNPGVSSDYGILARISKESSLSSFIVATLLPDVGESGISIASSAAIDSISGASDPQLMMKSDLDRLKLCYAPKTKTISKIFISEISTAYSTIKEDSDAIVSDEEGGNVTADNNDDSDTDNDDRINIASVTSHLFIDNFILGKYWISFSGDYEKISEILCRVKWEKIWIDANADKKSGPSRFEETEKHVQPELVQSVGKQLFFSNSKNNPDLYSVYSPCIFR